MELKNKRKALIRGIAALVVAVVITIILLPVAATQSEVSNDISSSESAEDVPILETSTIEKVLESTEPEETSEVVEVVPESSAEPVIESKPKPTDTSSNKKVAPSKQNQTKKTEEASEAPKVEKDPTPLISSRYTITASEREMLASLLYLEAGGESYKCQKMVLSTIFNRYDFGWGSLSDIVYQKGQFTPASRISSTTPTQTQYDVVDDVCENGVNIPPYVLYFRAGHYHQWSGHAPYTALEGTYFSYQISDKNKYESN